MQASDSKNQTPSEIEAELDRERARLSRTIDGLRDRLSVEALLGDAFAYGKANAAPYIHALDGAVRANPMAAVMAGVGLAWLVLGRKGAADVPEVPLAGTKFEALSRWEDEGGPVSELPAPDHRWIAEADGVRHRASAALARIDEAARRRLRPVANLARDRAAVLAELARDTRTAMLSGLGGMATASQDSILAARERAYAARIAAARQGARLIEDRPMLAGAIGMAIGAAVATALPRTRTEDRLFGPERDRLMAQAQHALRIERARAARATSALANSVAGEVKDAATRLANEAL